MRYLAVLVLLAGCATPQREPTPEERAAAFKTHIEHLRATYGPACTQYFEVQSEQWANCIVTLYYQDQDKQNRAAANRAAAAAYWGRAIQNFGNTAFPTTQPPRATQCQWIGDVWTCR